MRTILLVLFAAFILTGCAAALETITDALPVTQGELSGEIAEHVASASDEASSGNWLAALASGAGALGLSLYGASKLARRILGTYDDGPYEGNDETATEAEVVAATRAVMDRTPPPTG